MVYLLAPLVGATCLVLALGLLARCLRRGREARGNGPGSAALWRDLAAALLAMALAGYALGVLRTADWDESPSQTCASQRYGSFEPPSDGRDAPRLRGREVDLFPPSAVCHWSDGARDGVPSWLNPTILCLTAGALGAAGPWAVARRAHRAPGRDGRSPAAR
ncbi:hypothetical protein FH609_014020 [Streptomyces sp. 3MP-14]|uniref:Uncharacterized protein n=1 Tax=Streptomyces mimosae TaxID=2586635 RepID=A0A5N6A7T1_9ACTN|nr:MULTISPECIES: hypothetical protein [Streptomyces]KAB8164312.1 hypothetical protein FH607_016910 [Streptomyces mimosae]KAB8176589.1 hypothetical protein FH609_014020 [Streptomyces sp. 3MP-14]